MRIWKWRMSVVAAVAGVLLSIPLAASAATHTTTHNGSWNATAETNKSVPTQKYVTHNTAKGCAGGTLQSATMSFQLVWWNGGRKTPLWSSRDFAGGETCSPTKTIKNAKNPEVYLIITIHCQSFPFPCQGSGSWSITTNH
jgi:hypothetical protein